MKLRNKLMVASVMLIISVLMMTTASFAWFTISTAPEIKGLNSTVVTNENLEIAFATNGEVPGAGTMESPYDTGKNTTWGNLVNVEDTDIAATFQASNADKILRPATLNVAGTAFRYPTYGTDGRISNFVDIADSGTIGAGNLTDSDGKYYGYYFDIWVRTNMDDSSITLSEDGGNRSTEGQTGEGSSLTIEGEGATETAIKMAGDCLTVGYKVIGHSDLTYTQTPNAESDSHIVYADVTADVTGTITKFEKTVDGDGAYTLKNADGTFIVETPTANTAYLVRIYVWLDGTYITNAAASVTDGVITGTINLQFTNDAAASMDGED